MAAPGIRPQNRRHPMKPAEKGKQKLLKVQGTRMILPLAPGSITSLWARAASASGICLPTTGFRSEASGERKAEASQGSGDQDDFAARAGLHHFFVGAGGFG